MSAGPAAAPACTATGTCSSATCLTPRQGSTPVRQRGCALPSKPSTAHALGAGLRIPAVLRSVFEQALHGVHAASTVPESSNALGAPWRAEGRAGPGSASHARSAWRTGRSNSCRAGARRGGGRRPGGLSSPTGTHQRVRTSRARACTACCCEHAPGCRRAECGAARARRGARGVQRRAERRAQLGRAAAGLQFDELPRKRLHAARAQPQRQRRVQRQARQRERQQQAGRAGAAAARRTAAALPPRQPGWQRRGTGRQRQPGAAAAHSRSAAGLPVTSYK